MTRTQQEKVRRDLEALIRYVRREGGHKDTYTLNHLCEALECLNKSYFPFKSEKVETGAVEHEINVPWEFSPQSEFEAEQAQRAVPF